MLRSDIFRFLLVLSFLFLFISISTHSATLENIIKIPKQRSTYDISHDYHKTLLHMALKKAANGRKIPEIIDTLAMSQGRAIVELTKGEMLDVYWLGTSKNLESDLLPIKIPTTRGLIGYRKFIIHKDSIEEFNKIKTIEDLKKFSACQGAHWPDTQILRTAGLSVTTSTNYEDIFNMLNYKRCDYFPRGFHDSVTELDLRGAMYPNLISYKKIILHYPFAVYFFTNKSNISLASWIETGLTLLVKNGDIEKLMSTHPLTSSVFPFKDEKESVFIDLPNDYLSRDSNFHHPDYWIQPKDFNINVSKNRPVNIK